MSNLHFWRRRIDDSKLIRISYEAEMMQSTKLKILFDIWLMVFENNNWKISCEIESSNSAGHMARTTFTPSNFRYTDISLTIRMLCAKFKWIWPGGFREEVQNVKVYRRTKCDQKSSIFFIQYLSTYYSFCQTCSYLQSKFLKIKFLKSKITFSPIDLVLVYTSCASCHLS